MTTSGEAAQTPPTEPVAGSAAPSPDAVDLDALRAAAAELASLKAEQASAKQAAREERKRLQAEAEAAGEMQKAYEAAKARLAELEGLEPLAAKWRSYEAEEAKRLDAEAAALPEAVRDLYASASDVEARRKVLAAFKGVTSTTAPKGTPPTIGAPAPTTAFDMDAILADKSGKKAAEAKARDPQGFAAAFKTLISGGPRGGAASSLGIGAFARGPKAPNA